jgi:hypothetical protein
MTTQRTFNTASKPISACVRSCVWNQASWMHVSKVAQRVVTVNSIANSIGKATRVAAMGSPMCDLTYAANARNAEKGQGSANRCLTNFNLARYRTDSMGAPH